MSWCDGLGHEIHIMMGWDGVDNEICHCRVGHRGVGHEILIMLGWGGVWWVMKSTS